MDLLIFVCLCCDILPHSKRWNWIGIPYKKCIKICLSIISLNFTGWGGEPNICERYLEFLILHVTTTPGDSHMIRNVPRNGKNLVRKHQNNLSNGNSLRKSEESLETFTIQQVRDFSEAAFIRGFVATEASTRRGENNLCLPKIRF